MTMKRSDRPPLWIGVYEYPSKGRKYYRLMWGRGGTVHGMAHINGGHTGNPKAIANAQQLQGAIAKGASLLECLAIVRRFSEAKRGPRSF